MNGESMLSMDPNILLSMVNMKLRDFYSNLEALCEDLDVGLYELNKKLNEAGYNYSKENNQFK